MRPLNLKVSGLNSFKGEQEIDFTRLSDLGIFGIFGPTGSGKSSILDAMTLALYGDVIRAAHGKQGIINQAENKLSVSFAFSLGGGEHRHAYRVERAYKTKDHISVKNIHSRFFAITGGTETIVAEGENEVNRYAESLLGLTVEDFTRAVVLPQGNFADFLKMDGSKRRVMLERLFRLEKYGRQLTDKLNQRLENVNLQHGRLEGEQKGLGDASAEKLNEAEAQRKAAEGREQQALQACEAVTAIYEEKRKIYELQQELFTKEQELAEFQRQAPVIRQLTLAIKKAEQAKMIQPFLVEKNKVSLLAKRLQEEMRTTEAQTEQLAAEQESLSNQLKQVKKNRSELEPELIAQKTQLEAVINLETEVAAFVQKKERLEADIDEKQTKLQAAAEAIRQIEAELSALQDHIAALEKELGQNSFTSEYRQAVQNACSKAQMLEHVLLAAGQRRTEHAKRQAVLEKSQEELRTTECKETDLSNQLKVLSHDEQKVTARCPHDENELHQREIRLAELKAKLNEFSGYEQRLKQEKLSAEKLQAELLAAREKEQKLTERVATSRAALEARKQELNQLLLNDRRAMAVTLAAELSEGQPCPVCGALHHPLAAEFVVTADCHEEKERLGKEIAEKEQQLEKLEEALRQVETLFISVQTRYKSSQETVENLTAFLTQGMQNVGQAWHLPPGPMKLEALSLWTIAQTEALQQDREQLNVWQEERSTAERRKQEAEQKIAGLQNQIAALRIAVQNAQTEFERVQAEWKANEQQANDIGSALQVILNGRAVSATGSEKEDIAMAFRLQDELAECDRRSEHLQREIKKRRLVQQEQQTQREALQTEQQQGRIDLTTLKSQLYELTVSTKEKQERLMQVTQGQPVAVLITQLNGELQALKEKESDAQESYEANRDALFQRQQKLMQEKTALEEQNKRLDDLAISLEQQLIKTEFVSVQEVEAAYMDPVDFEEKYNKINLYNAEEQRLLLQCQELQRKLNGSGIGDAEWNALQENLTKAVKEKDKAVEERIRMESVWRDIADRHIQWGSLETQLQALGKQRNDLTTLKSLTRGNMLVEFMAQEQMNVILSQASERLKNLTHNRYALEMASDGSFLIRDDDNGGARRPVNMLSGGETFQTSLALALALSSHIQLRGQYPLEFFFLDEGFGSLDAKALEVVMSSLERLPSEHMVIGLISHVDALQQRLLRRLIVEPAEPNGRGSRVRIEIA